MNLFNHEPVDFESMSTFSHNIMEHRTPSSSLLMHLPVEILLLMVKELRKETPEYAFALALTCKTLYTLIIPEAPILMPLERDILLRLLEKESGVGSKYYFCAICHKLHRFSPSCGPLNREHTCFNRENRYLRPCYGGTSFFLQTGGYTLGYHHARLVLNRHLYGPPRGLPLDNLTVDSVPGMVVPDWEQSWTAKVIDDELFLRATHTIDSHGISDPALRSLVDLSCAYFICCHVDSSCDVSALEMPRVSSSYETIRPLFAECREQLDACVWCLTDHCTTIERKRAPRNAVPGTRAWVQPASMVWAITIVAYHRLGSCRSPYDWMWRSVVGATQRTMGNWRDNRRYPVGSIRDKWLASQS